jgi:hypothetical protein
VRALLQWLCALAACAAALTAAPIVSAAEPAPNPVMEPDRVWAFRGFALRPPPGEQWFSLMRSRDRVVFVKRVADAAYGFVAVATTEQLTEVPATPAALLAHVKQRRPQAPDPDRYELVERVESLEGERKPWCVRYRITAEDSRASYFYPHIVRISGRACLHSEHPGLLVDASYAEWAVEGADRPAVHAEGKAFLAGVRLAAPGDAAAVAEADALAERGADDAAVRLLVALAERGDVQAALRLGMAYERGRGVAADRAAAAHWYRIAADAGEVDALYNLGALHERAEGPARDVGEAVRWFRRAADQRDAQAQLNLGLLYLKGDGVAPDRAEARFWLQLASSNGSARARALLDDFAPELVQGRLP